MKKQRERIIDILRDKSKRNKVFILLTISIFIEFLSFFVWVQWMGNTNYFNPENIEFKIVRIIEKIITVGLPITISFIGVLLLRHRFAGVLGVLSSFPFIFIYSILVNNSVIQAYEFDYWFFIPAVCWFFIIQTIISSIIGLFFLILSDLVIIYRLRKRVTK